MFIFLGSMAFLLYVLYDINSVKWNNKVLRCGFWGGTIVLAVATINVVLQNKERIDYAKGSAALLFGIATIFFVLLIYTLFFALPFEDTYVKESSQRLAYTEGVYALCRHPGVLWFIGFYLFLGWGLGCREASTFGIVVSFWNVLYVVFQDKYSFPLTFNNYREYQKQTPFLIPNRRSIETCCKTLFRKKK